MDIQEEREAFEQALVNQKNVSINNLHVCTIFDAEKNKYSPSDVCDPKEDFIVDWINSSWSIWQAAKAQAVPEWIETAIQPPEEGHKVIISGIYGVGIAEFSYLYKDEFVMYDMGASNPILSKDQVKFWQPLPDAPQEPAND